MYLNRQSHLRGVIDGLGWENSKSHLIGHSMGAGISMLFAGCYPELIQKLVMIDGFGPRTKQASNACKNVRSAIEKEAKYYIKQSSFKTPKLYETFESAIRMRISSTANYPGNQTISYEAAAKLVAR
jgi:pimeloyl-ACP methyl ester carboxylesterase